MTLVGEHLLRVANLKSVMIRRLAAAIAGVLLSVVAAQGGPAWAQGNQGPEQSGLLGAGELQALVAPIALYPDPLLAEVLMASTYPLEIVQADRWLKDNEQLKADELKAAADKTGWDQSVTSLVATPSVLTMMSSELEWTQKLGDAVLAQQQDVMNAVQALRAQASANDKLNSTAEQKVTVANQNGKHVIAIEPATPETVYVPYYDPSVVYGSWPYSDYPAYYFPPPPYIPGAILTTGLAFGAGYALGRWGSGGNYWGGGINWNNNNININRPQVNPLGGGNWAHNPAHRGGVRYGNSSLQQRFGGSNARANAGARTGQKTLGATSGRADGARAAAHASRGHKQTAKSPSKSARQSASQGAKNKGSKTRTAAKHSPKASSANRSAGARNSGGGARHAPSQRARNSMASARPSAAPRASHAGRGGGGRGGGRRSDIRLKHDIVLLGYMRNGVGVYRFIYNGGHISYVGVLAQQVLRVVPSAVTLGRDGYLRVHYRDVGVRFQSYRRWMSGAAHQ